MKLSRRDVLKFLGGGVVGTIFSPIPWKLLRDSSVWTQNWPWIPVPLRGEVTTRHTACTLCPAGCGMTVRCIGGRPVLPTGLPNAAGQHAVLCPAGIGAHQLPWHPSRVRMPLKRTGPAGSIDFVPVEAQEAYATVAKAVLDAKGSVAILDGHTDRVVGSAYREFLAGLPRGEYLATPHQAGASLNVLRGMFATDPGPQAYDLDSTRTIVSFGAPVLDGWGSPGAVSRRFVAGDLNIIQIEAVQSRTAVKAGRWIPLTPGTEGVVALGIANRLKARGAVDPEFLNGDVADYLAVVERFPPRRVREVSGVDESTLDSIAEALSQSSPAIVIGGSDPAGGPLPREDEAAIQALNLMIGSVGRTGGILPRRSEAGDFPKAVEPATLPRDITTVPDGSIDVLVMDIASSGSILPWALVAPKLSPGALVVSLAPVLADTALYADLVLPTAPPMGALQDAPGHPEAPESLRLAVPFPGPEPTWIDPVTFLNAVGQAAGVTRQATAAEGLEELVTRRIEAVHRRGEGTVFQPGGSEAVAMESVGSPDELAGMLKAGGCWCRGFGETAGVPVPRIAVNDAWTRERTPTAGYPLTLIMAGGREQLSQASRSPILSKIDQESHFRLPAGMAAMNPGTIGILGLRVNRKTTIQTRNGALTVTVLADPGIPPGSLLIGPSQAAAGTGLVGDPLALCATPGHMNWRLTPARIREA